jgi:reactive intermediate/imine deaminase
MRVTFDNPSGIGPPVGNYSHVVRVEASDAVFLFISGQVAIDPEGNLVGEGDMARQCEQTFENLRLILEAHGATFADVVKLNTYATDMSKLGVLREVRARYISTDPPASTTVEVSALFRPEVLVEMEAVAVVATHPTSRA